MAETIFAGEEIEEFSLSNGLRAATYFLAILPGFTEDFLVGHCPGNTRYGNGYQKEIKYLG
ncbi:hypothetical protein GCM10007332_14030 [Epilithonimonas arachidiradicis]|uniref:Uncharacterized protein n=1 Tax=Epilithonimonas arachidiradicis TaxID=1617282 RepID=A0ABQ1X1M7_9FLAO|nr:hypothetical protein GCM10007332_14030 [Epilithonimonas arachidiradicis]